MKRTLDQVVDGILHTHPTPATLRGFEAWLTGERQIDVPSAYPATPLSMVFDMYRVEYAQAMLTVEILRRATGTIDDAERDAPLIMADLLTRTHANAHVLSWLRRA